MKVLVVGAGAVGGYFGGRLIEKGIDVTFLVREKKQAELSENGLRIQSIHGDLKINPNTITGSDQKEPFDVVLIGTKSYHLKMAIHDIQPFVTKDTMIIPMLNGIKHLKILEDAFSREQVLGGLCFIESTVNSEGVIVQTSIAHDFVFGEQSGEDTERILKIEELFSNTKATIRKSNKILTDMWHKYMFITALSGITTLFRSSVGPIKEAKYSDELITGLFKEIGMIMREANAPVAETVEESQIKKLNEMAYTMKSSMLRDMEKGEQIESNHLQGYLLELAEQFQVSTPYLKMVYTNLITYKNNLK